MIQLALLAAVATSQAASDDAVGYNRDVRPILAGHCFNCHGRDEKGRKAKLRLDVREGALAPLKEGRRAVVPGDPAKSELLHRVTSADPDEVMPPAKGGKRLKPEEIDILRRWIRSGAEYEGHWAFIPPKKVTPAGKGAVIDRFIRARLAREGLKPSPQADPHTLLRRVTFDLTGLPPTPEEADAFARDPSPAAYERIVDRLLKSPRYGEHMARFWLDAVRYADTHGLHFDNYREIWPYRDWVIRAFNENMPWDRFVTEQLAGDLLPAPTLDQQIATGFNRCNLTTNEGGSIKEEVYVRNVRDRVDTTGVVFLALTVGCSKCHDHKYDPLTMKDYYSLFAFFNSLDANVMDGNKKDHAPVVKVPTPEMRRELEEVEASIAKVEREMTAPHPEVDAAQAKWEAEIVERLRGQWTVLDPAEVTCDGVTFTELEDHSILAGGGNPERPAYEVVLRTEKTGLVGLRLEALRHESLPLKGTGRAANANFVLSEFEVEAVSVNDPKKRSKLKFASANADFSQKDFPAKAAIDGKLDSGWAVDGEHRREDRRATFVAQEPFGYEGGTDLHVRMRFNWGQSHAIGRFRLSATGDADLLASSDPAKLGPWYVMGPFRADSPQQAFKKAWPPEEKVRLKEKVGNLKWQRRPRWKDGKVQTLQGDNSATYLYRTITSPAARSMTLSLGSDDTISVWVNGERVLNKEVYRGVEPDQEMLEIRLRRGKNDLLMKICNGGGGYGFYFKVADEAVAGFSADLAAVIEKPAGKRTDKDRALLRREYRREHWPEFGKLEKELRTLEAKRKKIEATFPVTLVWKEQANPKEAFVLKRGEYTQKGEKVGRRTPASLPPMKEGLPRNRLGLAKWLLDPGHPLTARVVVNRFWQQCFGAGIVVTSEDFGIQGEPPSHPALLDWLAVTFIEDGWDVKKMMKRIVMSETYRQSSRFTPETLERDPQNRLLARGPRYRLDAEMLRDQALAVSGLLVNRLGGPSVKPPQPAGLWKAVGYTSSNTANFRADSGPEKVHRRSVYTFWKRTSPPPQMDAFDAPSREACRVRRERTNTPLQALILMNEPQYFEAARYLAQRAMKEATTDEARATAIFRLAAVRSPGKSDLEDLLKLHCGYRDRYAKDPEAAKKLITVGELPPDGALDAVELAAWTMVANLVLNLDEVVTKG